MAEEELFGAQIIQQQWEIKIFNSKQTLTHLHKHSKLYFNARESSATELKVLKEKKTLVDAKEAENCFQKFISAKLLWPLALFSLKISKKKCTSNKKDVQWNQEEKKMMELRRVESRIEVSE